MVSSNISLSGWVSPQSTHKGSLKVTIYTIHFLSVSHASIPMFPCLPVAVPIESNNPLLGNTKLDSLQSNFRLLQSNNVCTLVANESKMVGRIRQSMECYEVCGLNTHLLQKQPWILEYCQVLRLFLGKSLSTWQYSGSFPERRVEKLKGLITWSYDILCVVFMWFW